MQGLSKKYILLGWIWKPIGGAISTVSFSKTNE